VPGFEIQHLKYAAVSSLSGTDVGYRVELEPTDPMFPSAQTTVIADPRWKPQILRQVCLST
jgi:hypothetical protein